MRILACVMSVLTLAGCMHPIVLPDGSSGYAITCKNSPEKCYQKASKACPNGYEFFDKDKNISESAGVAGAFGKAERGANITYVIRCKDQPKSAQN